MAHGFTKHLPGMLGRKRKIQDLKKKRRATRVGHKRMARAEAQEAGEVAEDLAEGVAQKKFAKTYKKLESRPLYSKIDLGYLGENVDERIASGKMSSPARGTEARKKRVYSNKSTKKLKIGPFKNF
jgi:hypothetical protein